MVDESAAMLEKPHSTFTKQPTQRSSSATRRRSSGLAFQSASEDEMDDNDIDHITPMEETHSMDSERRASRDGSRSRVPLRRASQPRTAGAKKRFCGLPRDAPRQRVYTQHGKVPGGPWGKEFDDDVRVWKVYMDEAELFDVELTEGWKDTVDVFLPEGAMVV
ncbi:hypothetical protein BDV98DRAFT_595015 [Pterulicium gracile]|uniref:Uncharacterized protein n=1 Tax=Pterulicium gracile TaxID=1884261 RepID=A0A5C3QDS5_9AGAR|nr:hypothetical protein BDV98DRAFT_595015 [Pterula gracilis]